jgi:hypothetical protein
MKTITVEAVWRSTHTIVVPDEFEDYGDLEAWPPDALERVTSEVAELVDWTVRS